ncbi:VOC family protein [Litorisediminicola beolgyonensis]|uniref:VOC family protein n=1 Tax=Litorisediminicola beolgyonensis TaxID=1173614 RepID=A0ABW3ZIH3_9RHOB
MSQHAPAEMTIGHVHLKVSDLERSIAFYRDVIGLSLTQRYGAQAAFLSAGGYHHHIGLNTWESRGRPPADRRHPGLFHTAFLFPDRASLGAALQRAIDHGVEIEGAADHGVSEAVYFSDPDGNGIELYRDRPQDDWPRDADGTLSMTNGPLDLARLLSEAA